VKKDEAVKPAEEKKEKAYASVAVVSSSLLAHVSYRVSPAAAGPVDPNHPILTYTGPFYSMDRLEAGRLFPSDVDSNIREVPLPCLSFILFRF